MLPQYAASCSLNVDFIDTKLQCVLVLRVIVGEEQSVDRLWRNVRD